MTKRRDRRRRGYTMVEVMVGLAMLAIGSSGIIALIKTSVGGNLYARNLVTATHIAEGWIERLKTDALVWNSDTDLADTIWIRHAAVPAEWMRPALVAEEGAPTADIAGKDLYAPVAEDVAFCTHIKLTPLLPDGAALANAELVRAEVRVFFSRTNQTINAACADDTFGGITPGEENLELGFVYHATAIRRNTIEP